MIEEFADREPIWGWRDDRLEIMERQIDLAADHGIAFFAFCWYWNKDPAKVEKRPETHRPEVVPAGQEQPPPEVLPARGQPRRIPVPRRRRVEQGRRGLAAVFQAPAARHRGRQAAGDHLQPEQRRSGRLGPSPGGGPQGGIARRGHRRLRRRGCETRFHPHHALQHRSGLRRRVRVPQVRGAGRGPSASVARDAENNHTSPP